MSGLRHAKDPLLQIGPAALSLVGHSASRGRWTPEMAAISGEVIAARLLLYRNHRLDRNESA